MQPTIPGIIIGFALLSALFFVLQKKWPSIPSQKTFRRGFLTDLAYWAFTPLVTRAVTPIAVAIALVPLALAYGFEPSELKVFVAGHGPLADQPLWLQAVQIFVIGDFIGYWQHRWFHGGWRWHFHAIHHSSVELDWLSSVRQHPVNDMLARIITAVPIVALGYNVAAVAGFTAFTTLYAITLHANLKWTYGPLRYVVASPAFHRWHHTCAEEGQDKNFAGFLPLWDLMFGTFFLPKGRQPVQFGVSDPVPGGLLGQLVYPFRRRPQAGSPAVARDGQVRVLSQ